MGEKGTLGKRGHEEKGTLEHGEKRNMEQRNRVLGGNGKRGHWDMGKREIWDKGKEGICDLGKTAKWDIAKNMLTRVSSVNEPLYLLCRFKGILV